MSAWEQTIKPVFHVANRDCLPRACVVFHDAGGSTNEVNILVLDNPERQFLVALVAVLAVTSLSRRKVRIRVTAGFAVQHDNRPFGKQSLTSDADSSPSHHLPLRTGRHHYKKETPGDRTQNIRKNLFVLIWSPWASRIVPDLSNTGPL